MSDKPTESPPKGISESSNITPEKPNPEPKKIAVTIASQPYATAVTRGRKGGKNKRKRRRNTRKHKK